MLSVTLVQPITNVTFAQDSGPETVDMYALFGDTNGTADLKFTATSSQTSVASVSITGNTLTLNPTAGRSGFTIVRMVATDPSGLTSTNSFRVEITALAARSLDVTLDAKHRFVTFMENNRASATVAFTGPGTAVVHLGGDGLKLKGTVVQGSHIDMETVTLSDTTAKSHLTITGVSSGGNPAMIGNIIAKSSVGMIDVHKALQIGDVQGSAAILNLNIDSAQAGSISGSAGSIRLNIGTAVDENFNTTGVVGSLTAKQWIDSDSVTELFSAAAIHAMNVRGSFMPNLEATGTGVTGRSLDHVKMRGSIGNAWYVPGSTGSLDLAFIPQTWQGQFGTIASILDHGNLGGTLNADSVGKLKVDGAIAFANITLTGTNKTDLGSLTAGSFDIVNINSSGNIGSITTAMFGYTTIFAGVGTIPPGDSLPASQSDFSSVARIGSIRLHPSSRTTGFSDSLIAAAKLGTIAFGTATSKGASNPYGVACESLDSLTFLDKARQQSIALRKIQTGAELQSALKAHKWTLGSFQLRVL